MTEQNHRTRVIHAIGNVGGKVINQFRRIVVRWHQGLAGLLSRYSGDEMYIEYDSLANEYIIVAPHWEEEPDSYQTGHTAGKAAALLGLSPLIVFFVSTWVLEGAETLLPNTLWTGWLLVLATVFVAFFSLSALVVFMTLSVSWQVKRDRGDSGE